MYQTVPPTPGAAGVVERFWLGGGERRSSMALFEVIPDGNVDLVFCLSPSGCCGIHLFGPATRRNAVFADRGSLTLGMRFLPGHAPRLADVAHGDLLDARIRLDRVFGLSADDLAERLLDGPGGPSAAWGREVLEGLWRKASLRPMADPLCLDAAGLALSGRIPPSVSALAEALGVGVRRLERAFTSQYGLAPKKFLRLVRLQRAVQGLGGSEPAALAQACGFADQAHMANEVRQLTGRPPAALAEFLAGGAVLDAPPEGVVVHRLE